MKIFITEEIDPSENILRVSEDDVIEVNLTPEIIKQVIKRRNPIEVEYKGVKSDVFIKRVLNIHTYGMSKNGNNQVFAYQQAGGSASASFQGMKSFNYSNFGRNVLIYKNIKFETDSSYSRDPIRWEKVYAQI